MQRHFTDILRCVAVCNTRHVRKEVYSILGITLTNLDMVL